MLGWCLSVMTSCKTQNFPSLLFRTAPCAILQVRWTFWYTCHRKCTSKQALKYPPLACYIFQFWRNVHNSLNILKSPSSWPSKINVLLRNIYCCNQAFRWYRRWDCEAGSPTDVDLITWYVPLTRLSFSSCICVIKMAGVEYYLRLYYYYYYYFEILSDYLIILPFEYIKYEVIGRIGI